MQLNHVTLFVADIQRSRTFYRAVGFTPIVETAHYCRFGMGERSTVSIELHAGEHRPAAQIGLEFETPEALDAEVARLAAAGVHFVEQPTDRPWLWRDARLVDPDGHEWMFFYAGENKLAPPWRVPE